jgi:16S rRNA (guanine527-N7)-methyltransferase
LDQQLIFKHFSNLTSEQINQFSQLGSLYAHWNAQINVISRKDIELLFERHVLHSLAIHKFIQFTAGSSILDIGTGGGFPGVPMAIMNPSVQFTLTDSIGKKIKVVQEVSDALQLKNVRAIHIRSELIKEKFDFVMSRAVAPLGQLLNWSNGKIKSKQINALPNGLICLKGGNLEEEFNGLRKDIESYDIQTWFPEAFFESKKLIYVPLV